MYSTNLKNNRYLVRCLRVAKDIKTINFIIDTGAMFSCCNYRLIDSSLQENVLLNNEIKLIGGFIKGEYVKFYCHRLKQFTIGSIDMGEQNIWITFDRKDIKTLQRICW